MASPHVSSRNPWGLGSQSKTKPAYLPDFTAVFIALSAWLKPSAEPGNKQLKAQQADLDARAPHREVLGRERGGEGTDRPPLPMAMDVICVFCSAARSSTCPLASYPGTEHMRTGVFGLTCRPGSRASVRGRLTNSAPVGGEGPVGACADGQLRARGASAHLRVHDVGQVEWLLHDGHEGLSEVGGHEHVCHGQQAVRAEGLDQEQAVDGLPDGSCNGAGGRVGDSTGLRCPLAVPATGPCPTNTTPEIRTAPRPLRPRITSTYLTTAPSGHSCDKTSARGPPRVTGGY